jgi:prepilin-type N-terminal cleavage/methylation domain-containing protein
MSRHSEQGFSVVEVLAAIVISGVAMMGAMRALELSSRELAGGALGTRAAALVQDRLESKRAVRWQFLLEDDVDHDGVPEIVMRDDGAGVDTAPGDGVYTAALEDSGVTLVWTVRLEGGRTIGSAALASIQATASYLSSGGVKVVRMATLRANPSFVGLR